MLPTIRAMNARTAAWLLITGRLAIGSALVAFPGRAAGLLIRRRRGRREAPQLLRVVGVRDLVLASGLLAAVSGRGSARGWALAGAAADAVDLVATAAIRDDLEPPAFAATLAAATSGIVLGLGVAAALD
jgi:hypothetical protein